MSLFNHGKTVFVLFFSDRPGLGLNFGHINDLKVVPFSPLLNFLVLAKQCL